MLKRILSYLVFTVLIVIVFNSLDFVFDRFIAHGAFTFDSLSNIILPLAIAALLIAYIAAFRRFGKK